MFLVLFSSHEHEVFECVILLLDSIRHFVLQRLSSVLQNRLSLGCSVFTLDRLQSKTLILWKNVDQKRLESEFSIAICRPIGGKWQSKSLFLSNFVSALVDYFSVFDCRLSGVVLADR